MPLIIIIVSILMSLISSIFVFAWNGTWSNDAIWSWWTQTTSVKQGTNLYSAGVTSNAKWRIFKRDATNNVTNYIFGTASEADDHNAPSILAQNNKDVVVFYTEHANDSLIRTKRAAAGTLSFGSESTIDMGVTITYSQVLSHGDRVVLLTRSACQWFSVESTDYAQTWSEPQVLIDFCNVTDGSLYTLTQPTATAGVYHLAVYTRPTNPDWHDLLIGKIDLTNGNITNAAGTIGNLNGTGLPINETDLDSVGPVITADRKVRLLDIGTKQGKTYGWYAAWGDSFGPRYYYFTQDSSGTITRTNSGINAPVFAYEGAANYVGGVAIDRNGNNTVYISEEDSSSQPWKVRQYEIGSNHALTLTSTLIDSTLPLVRPVAPIGESSVLVQRLDTYNSYRDFQATAYERTRD